MSEEATINLEIFWEEMNLPLSFPIAATVLDLKKQLQEITGIDVASQKITLPYTATDESVLATLDLSRPFHLKLKTENEAPSSPPEDDDEAIEIMGSQVNGSTQEQFLGFLDPLTITNFSSEFEEKYQSTSHPKFFNGTCKEAVQEAKKRYIPLIIYLHYDEHENTAPFCMSALTASSVITLLDESFLFWVGRMDSSIEQLIKNFLNATTFPFMAVVGNIVGGMTVLDIIQGLMTPDDLFLRLMQILSTHTPTLTKLREESEQRELERQLVDEQDRAYLESLKKDEEKEKQKQVELEKQQQEEQAKQEILNKKEEKRKIEEQSLPIGPSENDPNSTIIVIRLPDGSRVQRRFLKSDTIGTLYLYARTKIPLQVDDQKPFDLITNFPRKIFNDLSTTLQDAQLFPQAMLFVNERE